VFAATAALGSSLVHDSVAMGNAERGATGTELSGVTVVSGAAVVDVASGAAVSGGGFVMVTPAASIQ